METLLLHFNDADLSVAAQLIAEGRLVAFPTETVYGLGANALNQAAVKSIFEAKGRPSDNPLIVHVADKQGIYSVAEVSPLAEKIIDTFLPGSLTVVLPKKSCVPDCVTAGLPTVAVRMPLSVQARRFIARCALPIAAPSANTSSRPSPTDWQTVLEDMQGKISAVLCGDDCEVGIESTVLDLTSEMPTILRPGVVTPSDIFENTGISVVVSSGASGKVNSPGMKYKHYAPSCPMYLTDDAGKAAKRYDQLASEGKNPVLLCSGGAFGGRTVFHWGETDRQIARNMFRTLRFAEKKYGAIVAFYDGKGQLADSLLNRLTKAAGGNLL